MAGSSIDGTDIVGTGTITSPATPNGSRLVVSIRTPGQLCSTVSASTAHASSRCSQLSSNNIGDRPRK